MQLYFHSVISLLISSRLDTAACVIVHLLSHVMISGLSGLESDPAGVGTSHIIILNIYLESCLTYPERMYKCKHLHVSQCPM